MATTSPTYDDIHCITSLDRATEEDLRLITRTFPCIDNHAHNVLQEEHAYGDNDYPFESITSEAQGHALLDHTHSGLAHIRGINQLAELYNCQPTLQDVKAAKYEHVRRDYEGLVKKCFAGTHAVLIDDGLSPDNIHPVRWHAQFVPTVARIVRIEALAAELLEQLVQSAGLTRPGRDTDWGTDQSEAFLIRFNTIFRNQIRNLALDANVRGFKSVVCYRTGLDVALDSRNVFRPHQSLTASSLLSSFHAFLRQAVQTHKYRVERKEVNDYLVVAVCDVLDKLNDTEGESLPIQFHTGLGDVDIDLVKANPAYMKPLISAFPNVDFVLLHGSYPYTREAGYMATNFANAWLDIGLIFPMLSRDGQEMALREALQLTPSSKLLWSTDGHLHPETFYLSNRQFRVALEKVLVEYVLAGDISTAQAINIAVDILFWNSDRLYKLDEGHKHPQLIRACGRAAAESLRTLVDSNSIGESFTSSATTRAESRTVTTSRPESLVSRAIRNPTLQETMPSSLDGDVASFDAFLKDNTSVKYIWISNVDFTGTTRLRMMPIAAFRKHLLKRSYPTITTALPHLLPNDTHAEGVVPTGEFKMVPDMSSICLNAGIQSPSATVQAWWMDDGGHYPACPRWALQKHIEALQTEFGLSMLMGVEIEVVFMQPTYTDDMSDYTEFKPLNMVHSWSNMTHQDLNVLPVVEEIVESLSQVGIDLDQFHAEAAPGQWEFPLPAAEPLEALDILYKARDVIRFVAHKHGLKATLYPRPFNFTCGSASHTHFSINGPGDLVEKHADSFLAGLLEHLSSVLAFTLPIEESYARIGAGIWAGGEYVCWGTQNREVPLRKCGPGHWELKTIDGIGNMYLSMAALVASGLHGLRSSTPLTIKDNPRDASEMTAAERKELGITTTLPKKLAESLDNLNKNQVLRDMLGEQLVDGYVALKKFEMNFLNSMNEVERRRWLIARY